jgi:hypothetical protein
MKSPASPLMAAAAALLLPIAAAAQEAAPDNGTDPTRLNTSFSVSFEGINLPERGQLDTLYFKYGFPISADRRTSLNLKLPLVSNSLGEDGYGLGDFSIKITHVPVVTRTHGIVVSAEAVLNTADAPDRGFGVDALKLTAIYAVFLKSGAIFAPSFLQTFSVGSPDPGRKDVNLTTIDFYYVPKLANPKAYMTIDPAILYDWESDEIAGAIAVTYGQSVDLGLPGNESFFIKPSLGLGSNRGSGLGLEVGFKVVGF